MQYLEGKQHDGRQANRESIIKQSIANQLHPAGESFFIVSINCDDNHEEHQKHKKDQEDNKRIPEDACISIVIDKLGRRKSIRSVIDHITTHHK